MQSGAVVEFTFRQICTISESHVAAVGGHGNVNPNLVFKGKCGGKILFGEKLTYSLILRPSISWGGGDRLLRLASRSTPLRGKW